MVCIYLFKFVHLFRYKYFPPQFENHTVWNRVPMCKRTWILNGLSAFVIYSGNERFENICLCLIFLLYFIICIYVFSANSLAFFWNFILLFYYESYFMDYKKNLNTTFSSFIKIISFSRLRIMCKIYDLNFVLEMFSNCLTKK